MAVMEMQSWSGDWNLPSIDIRCLEVLAYAKFAGCPLKVNRCDNPWKSPAENTYIRSRYRKDKATILDKTSSDKGTFRAGLPIPRNPESIVLTHNREFPVLQSGEDVLTTSSKIMDYLREKNFNADYQLTAKQGADTLAFVSLVHSKLYPAISFTLWMDDSNYTKFTRPWYAKRLPFPLNYFVPGRISKQTRQVCEGIYSEETDDVLESKLYKDAQESLQLLSTMLAGKEFFFGESPTTLDAVVFAHLAVIWRAPLPNNKLHNYLQGYDNLCMFCGRILQRYFPPEPEEQQQQPAQSSSGAEDDTADASERRNTLLAIGFAFMAMSVYALYSGLVQIEITATERITDDLEESAPDMSAFTFREQEQNDG